VILLSEVSHAQDVVISAKTIVALRTPHRTGNQDLRITVSVGISVYPADGTDAETLLKNADMALINAKSRATTISFLGRP
jgi:GGDEF domain-containing protein